MRDEALHPHCTHLHAGLEGQGLFGPETLGGYLFYYPTDLYLCPFSSHAEAVVRGVHDLFSVEDLLKRVGKTTSSCSSRAP